MSSTGTRSSLIVGAAFLVGIGCAACTGRVGGGAPTETPTSPPEPTSTVPLPAASATPEPTASPTSTAEPTPAVLIAVGDIASCDAQGDEAVAELVADRPGTLAVLGDTVYPAGSAEQFQDCYNPAWGPFKDRTRPSVGNHEYLTPGASGYFDYFGPAAGPAGLGYYSYDLGAWHIAVLNSNCWEVGGCGREAPQALWLAADLRDHPAECTLAYWHDPRFSSGRHGGSDLVGAYWDLLYQAGADIVLSGHDHDYERFAPQGPQGQADPEHGMREFVVGTGGFSHYPFPGKPIANSEARDSTSFGVLVLKLFPDRYDWEFVPIAGKSFTDSGSSACHGSPGPG